MKKISVIIPVYNCEEYIKRCIDSIINQTYDNIQIIVVNDGSTDNTENILKNYTNITLINKKNEGVSKARNTGLSLADGDYVYFCDADDFLEKNAFEVLVNEYGENDLLRFGHYVVNGDDKKEKTNADDVLAGVNLNFDNEKILEYLISNKTEGHLWNYLFKLNVIKDNKILFDEELFYQEDVMFLLEYCLKIKNVKVISNPFYNYYVNENSVTKNIESSIRNLSSICILRHKYLHLLKNNDMSNLSNLLEQRFLNLQLSYMLDYRKKLTKKEYVRVLKRISDGNQQYYKEVLKEPISKKWKIFINLLKKQRIYLFNLYISLYLMLKK